MKKTILRTILLVLFILLPVIATAEDPADDRLLGTVHFKPNLKLDAQARKYIAAVAAKIKKAKTGTVKLRGSYSTASTEDDYLTKSVFMAREVEQYLKTLLPARQKIYTIFSPFSDQQRPGQNQVEIFLYPHELKVADFEGFRVNTVEGKPLVQQLTGNVSEEQNRVEQTPVKIADDGNSVTRGTVRPEQTTEDVKRADELVRRAKERAANRAKRKDDAE